MYSIIHGTRLIQTLENKRKKVFTLYNNIINTSIEINYLGYKLLHLINKGIISIESILDLPFIKELIQLKFISKNDEFSNINISPKFHYRYPLTSISMEIINQCNLNCVHCYGHYGIRDNKCLISFDWIKNNLSEFNKLNVLKIALTGGEATLHPDFLNIVYFLLDKGFDLTIFTNGFNIPVIKQLVETTENYHFKIKISLDGPESIHNKIRGNCHSYSHIIEILDLLNKYKNIQTYISTVVMPDNLEYIKDLQKYISKSYPNFIHTLDLVFPAGNGANNHFNEQELKNIYKWFPELFTYNESNHSQFRCTGGVTQCTITPNGKMKICNAADSDNFLFKYNVFDYPLSYVWRHCGKNISCFRKEKFKKTKDCISCTFNKKCKMIDCRVLAYFYKGDVCRSNPVTCISAKNHFKEIK